VAAKGKDLQVWMEERMRHHLTHAQVQMARELGMNPQKLGKLDNHKQERWKAPLPEFIERLYFKRFGKTQPDRIISLERAKEIEQKRHEKREHKRLDEVNK
jgi:histone acetyltransferase (RNA polymerase elongator complex component)